MCCRNTKANRDSKTVKPHYFYNKTFSKQSQELDIVHLLRQSRQIKLLTQVLLNQRQKMLLKFQRKNLIETSSSSEDSDN